MHNSAAMILNNRRRRVVLGYYGPTWSYNPATGIWTNVLTAANGGLGADCVYDPGMNDASKWIAGAGWDVGVTTPGVATRVASAVTTLKDLSGTAAIAGRWYQLNLDFVRPGAGYINMTMGGFNWGSPILTGTYRYTTRALNTNHAELQPSVALAGAADNFHVYPITTACLFLTRRYPWANGTLAIPITNVSAFSGVQGGVVACLDSQSSPLNYFLLYRNGEGNICLDKVVAGTKTSIINTATGATYHQNYYLVFKRTATTVQIFYNAAGNTASGQIGSDYTLVGGDPNGTIHGHFATDEIILLGQGIFTGA